MKTEQLFHHAFNLFLKDPETLIFLQNKLDFYKKQVLKIDSGLDLLVLPEIIVPPLNFINEFPEEPEKVDIVQEFTDIPISFIDQSITDQPPIHHPTTDPSTSDQSIDKLEFINKAFNSLKRKGSYFQNDFSLLESILSIFKQHAKTNLNASSDIVLDPMTLILNKTQFTPIVKLMTLPSFLSTSIFKKCANDKEFVTFREFSIFWDHVSESVDIESLVFSILKTSNEPFLYPRDFEETFHTLVETHPGIEFLCGDAMKEFRNRYGTRY